MYPIVFLGGVGAGGVFSGTNPAYKPYEVKHHIRTAKVRFFIVEPELLESVLPSARECGIGDERVFIFNVRGQRVPEGSPFRSWEWLLEQGEEDWVRITDKETLENTEVARLTTSGTTGLPKMARQSHYNATSFHDQTKGMGKSCFSSNVDRIVVAHTPREMRLLFRFILHVSHSKHYVSGFLSNRVWDHGPLIRVSSVRVKFADLF